VIVNVGQSRTPLKERLGSRGYSTISGYNNLAPQPGRRNGGQQTNCRVNPLANNALGKILTIWFRVTSALDAAAGEGPHPVPGLVQGAGV